MSVTNTAAPVALTDAHVRAIVARHFHPTAGTRFWLERAHSLGLDARDRIRRAEDLALLGPLLREQLHAQPLLHLVPAGLHADLGRLVLSETGGTSGTPLRSVFSPEEFRAGFVEPFQTAVRARGFPTSGAWAFVGPSGPHVIHQAARAFARAAGCLEPFAVDFDPRWARAQSPGSLGARLYREHVAAQALAIFRRERIEVVFSTPPVLLHLAAALPPAQRANIRGIHIGGMALDADTRAALHAAYAEAVLLPAYGNSLAGISPELSAPGEDGPARYALPAGRLRLRVLRRPPSGVFDAAALHDDAAEGECGRVVLDRLDPTFLIANLIERDEARMEACPVATAAEGFLDRVLVDPRPAREVAVEGGLY